MLNLFEQPPHIPSQFCRAKLAVQNRVYCIYYAKLHKNLQVKQNNVIRSIPNLKKTSKIGNHYKDLKFLKLT